MAVAIAVEEGGAAGEARVANAGGPRHVGEGPVAIVPVEDAAAKAGDEQIHVAVIVEVADRAADAVDLLAGARAVHARPVRDVLEPAPTVAAVPVETVAKRGLPLVARERGSLHQIDIQPPIAVVVEQ